MPVEFSDSDYENLWSVVWAIPDDRRDDYRALLRGGTPAVETKLERREWFVCEIWPLEHVGETSFHASDLSGDQTGSFLLAEVHPSERHLVVPLAHFHVQSIRRVVDGQRFTYRRLEFMVPDAQSTKVPDET